MRASTYRPLRPILFSLLLKLALEWSSQVMATTLTAFPRSTSEIAVRSAISRDARYGPWPNATRILYRLDANYTASEQTTIQRAMSQIMSDMNGCIKFEPYLPGANNGSDYVFISKTLNSGQAIPLCFSFPGRVLGQAGQGQKMILLGSSATTSGCLDTPRDVMKYLLHVLGIRNEFNRPDRDDYIRVFTANVLPELQAMNLLKVYTAVQIDYLNTAFDYNSVTIPSQTKYAIPGTVLFVATPSNQTFGSLSRLSHGDCVGLALQYAGCNAAVCSDPYVKNVPAAIGPADGVSGNTTNKIMRILLPMSDKTAFSADTSLDNPLEPDSTVQYL